MSGNAPVRIGGFRVKVRDSRQSQGQSQAQRQGQSKGQPTELRSESSPETGSE